MVSPMSSIEKIWLASIFKVVRCMQTGASNNDE